MRVALDPKTRAARRRIAELQRRLCGQPHVVSAFLGLDDPYSYLLSHFLPGLSTHYEVELRSYPVEALNGAYRPRPDMLAEYAERDAGYLARELGVPFLDIGRAPPVEHRRALLDVLAAELGNDDFHSLLLHMITQYWRGAAEDVRRHLSGTGRTGLGADMLAHNQARLAKLGHYNSAMLHYGGEWYWGIDRLCYLTERLDRLGLRRTVDSVPPHLALRQATNLNLPIKPPSTAERLPPLELFFSFRSPYSYLSLGRVYSIVDAFGLELTIRPVLPMIMRGMQMPKPKMSYIAQDAVREAERLEIPFGNFCDPVGAGVERCMAVFTYAASEKREREFVINAAEAIWARGIDVATDVGMRKVTARTGLFWPAAKSAMSDGNWRAGADGNKKALLASGCWGVPTMRLGDFVGWGQDRSWLLVRHIEELCDTGDGILV
jgi:2-hydroxychromene-2-carboxylate isomerase